MNAQENLDSPSEVDVVGRREFLATSGATALATGIAPVAWSAAGVGCPTPAFGATGTSDFSASVVERIRVTRGSKRHRAFPGLVRLNDGTLQVYYREGAGHWRTPGSVVPLTQSTDGGATWSEPRTIMSQVEGLGYAAHHGPRQLTDGILLLGATAWRYQEGRMFGGQAYACAAMTLAGRGK